MKYWLLLLWIGHSFWSHAQDNFDTCYTLEDYGGMWPQYFQIQSGFEGGLYELKKQVIQQDLNLHEATDGYYTIRFIINCNGHIGRFEPMACDEKYGEIPFDPELAQGLIRVLSDLQGWKAGKQGNGLALDSQKFLTFIVSDGQLTDIVPK